MVRAAYAHGADIVTHGVKPSTPDWYWHDNGSAVFESPWRSLLFFMLLSARAADVLLSARQRLAAEFREGRITAWPFCEVFVPTVLKAAGLRFAEVSDFADTIHLCFRPRMALDDSRANRRGSLAHSVMGVSGFLRAVVNESHPRDWFDPDSELRSALRGRRFDEYADLLRESFTRQQDHAGLQKFLGEMEEQGMKVPQAEDLAYCKPALSSSTSEWSHFSDPQKDGSGANGAIFHSDYGFHTAKEENPWWMVDLIDEYVVDEVRICNRSLFPSRFVGFVVESSIDGGLWTARHTKLDASEVSANPDSPHRTVFRDPFVARFVRIRALGSQVLHLRRVQVFGRGLLARRPAAPM